VGRSVSAIEVGDRVVPLLADEYLKVGNGSWQVGTFSFFFFLFPVGDWQVGTEFSNPTIYSRAEKERNFKRSRNSPLLLRSQKNIRVFSLRFRSFVQSKDGPARLLGLITFAPNLVISSIMKSDARQDQSVLTAWKRSIGLRSSQLNNFWEEHLLALKRGPCQRAADHTAGQRGSSSNTDSLYSEYNSGLCCTPPAEPRYPLRVLTTASSPHPSRNLRPTCCHSIKPEAPC
jgi:hypothetical protein